MLLGLWLMRQALATDRADSSEVLVPLGQVHRRKLSFESPGKRGHRSQERTQINVIQPSRLDAVKEVLSELGIDGLTISEVRGHGRQKGHTEMYRGREYSVDLLPKIKIESVMDDNQVDAAVDAILQAAATGKIGDGKIFLSKVDQAIRIRNQERGVAAL